MQADRIRFTIAVDAEVHQAFSDLAHISGVSLSRLVGDWLRDTSEAAHLTAMKVAQVRRSPTEAVEDLLGHSVAPRDLRAIAEATGAVARARGGVPLAGGAASPGKGRAVFPLAPAKVQAYADTNGLPPPSNTGGKVPRKNPNHPSKKAGGL